ncbi:hypothetical protein IJH66_01640 [Candidatus Saccharibacteria bacterium]|nr:hypothetical protein [Candidatus Saccharibacteria bacterium]
MRKLSEVIETVKTNIALNEELKATNHLYRALHHAVKGYQLSEQEKARLGELAEYTKDRIICDLTFGEQALCAIAITIVLEAIVIGAIIGLSVLFPTLNGVSDTAITLILLTLSLIVVIPTVYLLIRPNGLLYWIAEKRAERRERWLDNLCQDTSETRRLANAPTIRIVHNNN